MKNSPATLLLIPLLHASLIWSAETNHAAQLRQLTEKRDSAVRAAIKPIDAKYHEYLGNLQKSAAAANDFETASAIQKILSSSKSAPTMEDYFSAGSKWTGVRSGGVEAEYRVNFKVIRSDATTATIEYENKRGTWELGLSMLNGLIKLESCKAIKAEHPSRLYDLMISGRMEMMNGKKRLELKGSWKWKNTFLNRQDEETDVRLVMEEP